MKCKSLVNDGIGCIRDVQCGVCSAPPSHVIAKLAFLPPPFHSSFLSKLKQNKTSPSGEHNDVNVGGDFPFWHNGTKCVWMRE
jgi:hypothetical protein